jgi:hypothetical protein
VNVESRVEYTLLVEIIGADRNPKGHDIEAIKRSIRKFGFVNPAILDESTGQLVVGHGRIQALREMEKANEPMPNGIILDVGDIDAPDAPPLGWRAPVLRGVAFTDFETAEAYLLADNRLTELGGWEDGLLKEVLDDLNTAGLLELTGFTQDDLEDLIARVGVPELPVEPFGGTYAETPEELAQRQAEAEAAGIPGLREVVMLLPATVHAEFVARTAAIRRRFDLPNNTQAVLYAIDHLWFHIPTAERGETEDAVSGQGDPVP